VPGRQGNPTEPAIWREPGNSSARLERFANDQQVPAGERREGCARDLLPVGVAVRLCSRNGTCRSTVLQPVGCPVDEAGVLHATRSPRMRHPAGTVSCPGPVPTDSEGGGVGVGDVGIAPAGRCVDQHAQRCRLSCARQPRTNRSCMVVPTNSCTFGALIVQVAVRLSLTVCPISGGVVSPGPTGWPAPTLPAANTGDDDTMDAPATTAPPAIIFLSASRRSIARSPDQPVRTVVLASGHHDAKTHAR
jgi:hypothetical protein